MIFTLLLACISTEKDLIGDSDRPFEPSINDFESSLDITSANDNDQPDEVFGEDSGENPVEDPNASPNSALSVSIDGDDIQVEHTLVNLPCDFDSAEINFSVNTALFQVEIIYTEREPENCYYNLNYDINFEGAPSGTYLLTAQEDEINFEI